MKLWIFLIFILIIPFASQGETIYQESKKSNNNLQEIQKQIDFLQQENKNLKEKIEKYDQEFYNIKNDIDLNGKKSIILSDKEKNLNDLRTRINSDEEDLKSSITTSYAIAIVIIGVLIWLCNFLRINVLDMKANSNSILEEHKTVMKETTERYEKKLTDYSDEAKRKIEASAEKADTTIRKYQENADSIKAQILMELRSVAPHDSSNEDIGDNISNDNPF